MSRLLQMFLRASFFLLALTLPTIVIGCGSGNSAGSTAPAAAPPPNISALSPASVPAGSAGFTLAVTGSGFVATSKVLWNSTALATTYVSSTSLTAAVPASLLGTGATDVVSVMNPGGGTSSLSATVTNSVAVNNPVPTLLSVAPTVVVGGASSAVLTLTGTSFTPGSIAAVNGGARPTQVTSATSLAVTLSAADLAAVASTLQVTVSNPAPGGGTSSPLPVYVQAPGPVVTSLSPATVIVGSGSLTLTVTGANFTSSCQVLLNAQNVQTTFVSATTLTAELQARLIASTVPVTVSGSCPGATESNANTLQLPVVNPVPTLTSVSPDAVVAGAPQLEITLTGSNFVPGSTVLVNGVAAGQNLGYDNAHLAVELTTAQLATPGSLQLSITSPAPGGGTSASVPFQVLSAANRVRTVNLPANDVVSDEQRHLLYVASGTATSTTSSTGSVAIVDPATGTVTTTTTLPANASLLALTDDQQFLYVATPGAVLRLNLPDLSQNLAIPLGADSNGNPYTVVAMQAAPGQPHVLALTTANGVTVYDDAVPRPATTGLKVSSADGALAWGATANTLYATNGSMSGGFEYTFDVSAGGAVLQSRRSVVFGDFVRKLFYERTTQHLFDGYGNVVLASTGQLLGRFAPQNSLSYETNGLAVDSALHRAFIAVPAYGNGSATIQVFNEDTFLYINSLVIPSAAGSGASPIVRWGASGLALAGQQLTLIDGPFVAPNTMPSSATGGYAQVSPTLTAVSPAAIPAGSPDTTVTLTGQDFAPSATAHLGDYGLPVTYVNATSATVTLSANLLAIPSATKLTIDNGTGTGTSNPLGITVLPAELDPALNLTILPVGGNDLVWNAAAARLYLAVDDSDPVNGNQILSIDPAAGSVTASLPTAGDPLVFAISDDNQFLYAGFGNLAVVQQYKLPFLQTGSQFQLVPDIAGGAVGAQESCTFAVAIAVAPGQPQTLAVTGGNTGIHPRACGYMAIYDSGIARPQTLGYDMGEIASSAWTADLSTLFSQGDADDLYKVSASAAGVSLVKRIFSSDIGGRVHYDPATDLIYSDSGRVSSPGDLSLVATFPASGLMIPDSQLGIAFFLGLGPTDNDWMIQTYDLHTRAPLRTFVLPPLLGYPLQFVRWGSTGLAFTTYNNSGGPNATYIVNSPALISTTPEVRSADVAPVHLTRNRRTVRPVPPVIHP